MILSSSFSSAAHRAESAITLGDTLLKQGLEEAAHFCYMVVSEPPENYTDCSNRFVLVGSDH